MPRYSHEGFADLDQAREWCRAFVNWYNDEHKHSALKFVTPSERHSGKDIAILASRDKLYQAARAANPTRWSGETRNWQRPETMTLNADKTEVKVEKAA